MVRTDCRPDGSGYLGDHCYDCERAGQFPISRGHASRRELGHLAVTVPALPPHLQRWAPNLLFDYESTGSETLFRDLRDPDPRSRRLFAFHKPATLFESLKSGSSLRRRLLDLPALSPVGLRDCQVDAIQGLEKSLKRADLRALVQMATGGERVVPNRL